MRVLRVDASARIDGSVSRRLGDRIVAALGEQEGTLAVANRDLSASPPPLLDEATVAAFNTPADQRDEAQLARLATSVAWIEELRSADVLLITTPIYNFGLPAALKAWIDLVVRARETFRYTSEGPKGLLVGKRAIVAIASGGTTVDTPGDFATPHLRQLLRFVGFEAIEVFAADGLVRGGEARIEAAEADIEGRLSGRGTSRAEAPREASADSASSDSSASSASSASDASAPVAVEPEPRSIEGYHAHVYGAADRSGKDLDALHARAQQELTRARVGRLRREPVGPHPVPMFQIAFGPDRLDAVLPWLMERREGRSVLVHPLHGAHLAEHTDDALWLGERLELDVSVF